MSTFINVLRIAMIMTRACANFKFTLTSRTDYAGVGYFYEY